jgi:fructosamine-3-kinase
MSRRDIHYWKCDRPAAFHGTRSRSEALPLISRALEPELRLHFNTKEVALQPAPTQGNHLAWTGVVGGNPVFVRVEDGPENDGHLAVESILLDRVRSTGVRTPLVLGCDATRSRVPFAWQVLERIDAPDLNHWFKAGTLNQAKIAFDIGVGIANWQKIALAGFGTLDDALHGHRTSYEDYFHLRLDEHLHFLKSRGFLANTEDIRSEIEAHRGLLSVEQGCLVHKDLALWNVLGTPDEVTAFIDFDDAISGDALEDLSLLGCFHDATFLRRALEGYQSVRGLPPDYLRRFWLHLLRNMIVKAVIRVGSGYFERSDRFFLIGAGLTGADLERTTRERLAVALRGLRENSDLSVL